MKNEDIIKFFIDEKLTYTWSSNVSPDDDVYFYRNKNGKDYALFVTDFVGELLDASERIEENGVKVAGFLKPSITNLNKFMGLSESPEINEYFVYFGGNKYMFVEILNKG